MKYVNLYGNGLSIGAALLIIIPEGVSVMTASFLDQVDNIGSLKLGEAAVAVDVELLGKTKSGLNLEGV